MKTYNYTFSNEEVNEVEVSDELYEFLTAADDREKNDNKRERRRHVSLTFLESIGKEPEAYDCDPYTYLIQKENKQELQEAMSLLKPEQRELLSKIFFEGKTTIEIGQAEGVDRTAISHRLATIYKKIKKLL